MTAETKARAEYMRRRYLPAQLIAARKRVIMLEREAVSYGRYDLLEPEAELASGGNYV